MRLFGAEIPGPNTPFQTRGPIQQSRLGATGRLHATGSGLAARSLARGFQAPLKRPFRSSGKWQVAATRSK